MKTGLNTSMTTMALLLCMKKTKYAAASTFTTHFPTWSCGVHFSQAFCFLFLPINMLESFRTWPLTRCWLFLCRIFGPYAAACCVDVLVKIAPGYPRNNPILQGIILRIQSLIPACVDKSQLSVSMRTLKGGRPEGEGGPYLSIRCRPLAVSTTPLISPGCRPKAATSNSFCMSPLPK